jgi:hypothetical protein
MAGQVVNQRLMGTTMPIDNESEGNNDTYMYFSSSQATASLRLAGPSANTLRLGYGLACRGVPRVVDIHLGGNTVSRGLKLEVVRGSRGLANHTLFVRLGAMIL